MAPFYASITSTQVECFFGVPMRVCLLCLFFLFIFWKSSPCNETVISCWLLISIVSKLSLKKIFRCHKIIYSMIGLRPNECRPLSHIWYLNMMITHPYNSTVDLTYSNTAVTQTERWYMYGCMFSKWRHLKLTNALHYIMNHSSG